MELWLPEQVAVDEVSRGLIADVKVTARSVNDYRPLPGDVVKRIEDDLLGERVYSSNAIEGNTLDLRETVMILKKGILGAKKKREATEARNLADAARQAATWIDAAGTCHTSANLRRIHAAILRDIDDQWAGRFRDKRVMIQGATHQPPDASLVEALVERTLEQLRSPSGGIDTIVLAAWAHWAISRIHPFYDGNGRVARLWQDLVLSQGGLTCAIIRPEDRRRYLDALGQADEGDLNPLVQLVAERVARTFDVYLSKIAEDQETNQFVRTIVGETDARIAEHRTLAYQRWARRMEQLALEFELLAGLVTDASNTIRIQVHRLEIIDQTTWENLRAGRRGGSTAFFRIDLACANRFLRYFFFFGKHYWSADLDTQEERSENRVCLMVSEKVGDHEAVRLDAVDQPAVTLREVFVVDDRLVRKRFDIEQSQDVYDRDVSPRTVARDFLGEVVLHKLT